MPAWVKRVCLAFKRQAREDINSSLAANHCLAQEEVESSVSEYSESVFHAQDSMILG